MCIPYIYTYMAVSILLPCPIWSLSVSPHGASYGTPYGAPYGAPYGPPYGGPYGAPYGAPYGVPYEAPCGLTDRDQIGQGNKIETAIYVYIYGMHMPVYIYIWD